MDFGLAGNASASWKRPHCTSFVIGWNRGNAWRQRKGAKKEHLRVGAAVWTAAPFYLVQKPMPVLYH